MSVVPHPHTFFPRSQFDLGNWMNQTLDHYDPFDQLDHMMGTNMHWLQRPSFLEPMLTAPIVPEKYRITVDCPGYDPKSITTEFKNGKLYVKNRKMTLIIQLENSRKHITCQ